MSMLLMVKAMQTKVGNPLRKLVLIKLADNANDKGECWPSYQHIADQCEISKRSVINHVNKLEDMGLLRKQYRKGTHNKNSSNLYTLELDGENTAPSANAAPPSESPALPPSESPAPRTSHSLEPVNEPIMSGKPDVDAVEKSLIDYLNTLANRNYKHVPSNIKFLKARLAEGHTPQEIADVIARKCQEWLDDPHSSQYLRPATLFNAEKFNQYVGQLGQPLPPKRQAATKPEEIDFDSTGWLRT